MNFIFISPNFPQTYWNFCDRLRRRGVTVLGIGDASYDSLEPQLKGALNEYYRVDSLEVYEAVFKAVAAASPSLWAGDWPQYSDSHPMLAKQVYLSLGDREEYTRNKTMARSGDRLRAEHARLQAQLGANRTTLVWEQGGHFNNPAGRMARAFSWTIEQLKDGIAQ